jgi:carotenoid cleavage dioxygenase
MTTIDHTTNTNPYLRGNFAPVDEERTDVGLEVSGSLPTGLNGRLLRDGPNPARDPGPGYHWFVGDGMVHGIELRDGKALSYRNRWVRTPEVEDARGLAAAPLSPKNMGLGSGGVNVLSHADRVLALGEVGLPWELDLDLDTVCQYDFDGKLVGSMTAHPKIDPVTGEMLFFGYDFGPTFLRYHRADANGNLVQSEDIDIPQCTMMHDFGVSETRVVFMDLPVVFDLNRLASGGMPFQWDESAGARLGVMPRDGSSHDVVWLDIEPCYVFHPLNTYDDGDAVVMDVVKYERMFATDHSGPDGDASLHRWTIDPVAGVVKDEQLDDGTVEFPRIDDRLAGRAHRYGYAAQIQRDDQFTGQGLVKWDLQTGASTVHDPGPGRPAGEGVFIPASENAGEDEGWVLSVVYDKATDRSDLIVIDASDFAAPPVATVHLPVRVPFGFHGNWVPSL